MQNAFVCSCNLQVFLFCMDVVHSYDAIALSIHGQASQGSHIQTFWLEREQLEEKTRQANHPNSVTLPELLNLHPESGTFVSFPRFYAVYLRNICSKGPEMQQRLSASPEQLQRPACLMFEAAFICIYRELGLCLEACPSHCFCIFT